MSQEDMKQEITKLIGLVEKNASSIESLRTSLDTRLTVELTGLKELVENNASSITSLRLELTSALYPHNESLYQNCVAIVPQISHASIGVGVLVKRGEIQGFEGKCVIVPYHVIDGKSGFMMISSSGEVMSYGSNSIFKHSGYVENNYTDIAVIEGVTSPNPGIELPSDQAKLFHDTNIFTPYINIGESVVHQRGSSGRISDVSPDGTFMIDARTRTGQSGSAVIIRRRIVGMLLGESYSGDQSILSSCNKLYSTGVQAISGKGLDDGIEEDEDEVVDPDVYNQTLDNEEMIVKTHDFLRTLKSTIQVGACHIKCLSLSLVKGMKKNEFVQVNKRERDRESDDVDVDGGGGGGEPVEKKRKLD